MSAHEHEVPPFDFGVAYEIVSRFCDSDKADATHREGLDAIRRHCGSLLAALENGLAQPACPEDGVFVVIEGLDGVGKTTLVETVCELLSSNNAAGLSFVRAIRTPPEEVLCHREAFDILGRNSVVRRAFYALGNFIAGEVVREELHRRKLAGEKALIICDRFHLSTAAYYVWQREDVRSKELFKQNPWPQGLLLPTLCVHVELEETERTKRLHARCAGSGTMTGEERRLSEHDRAVELKTLYCELGHAVHTMYPSSRFERLDITGMSRHQAGESLVSLISACS